MTNLSITGEGDGVVGAAGHFCHSLVKEVGWYQGRGQTMVGGPISQLAVAIVAPGVNLTIYTAARTRCFMLVQWLFINENIKKQSTLHQQQ